MVMVLKPERQLLRCGLIRGALHVRSGAHDADAVLDQHAVVQHGDVSRACEFARRVEARAMEDDVVGLPLARPTAGVDEWRVLSVDRGCLSVRVGLTLVGIEHLNFIEAVQKHAAVATVLVLTVGRAGRGPFDVQLAVPKGASRLHVSRARGDLEVSIADFPFRRAAIGSLPLGQVRATEQHGRV